MTEALLVAASPVFRVDGTVRGEMARDVLRLEVAETVEGLRTLELVLLAVGPETPEPGEGLLYLDGALVDFGSELAVSLGPAGADARVFDGRVSALEVEFREGAEPAVTVRAEDRLMDFRMTRRMRTWESMSDADIAGALASEHGISADVSVPGGPTYDVVQQWNQSDLAFLRDRADLAQAELWLADGALHFRTRGARDGADVELVQGVDLVGVRAAADLAHQRTRVTVSGYDAQRRERIDGVAGPDAVQAEVSGGLTGPALLERVFGARPTFRVREAPLAQREADAWSRAEMLRRARGFVTVEGVTRGTPRLDVGAHLTLRRVGPPFEGDGYRVTSVRHTYDLTSGHRTAFTAERPTVGQGGA